MKLGKVIGNITSTIKTQSHNGLKMMIVELIDQEENNLAETVIAVDCAQSGIGDIVLILEEGGSAREVMKRADGAVDAVIVGIVDKIDLS